jgi:L-lactate dehydrogenase complex protein LldF
MRRAVDDKHRAQQQVPWEELRTRAHALKAYAIANLDKLLVQFEREFVGRGGSVLWAATAEEAADACLEICRKHGAKTVVKGKSMVSEEIELNHRLADNGIAATETDLGEYIVQLAGQRPSHLIGPALHMSRSDVGELFAEELGVPDSDDPATLIAIARERLRRKYLEAEVGVTGANFAIAETGTIVVVENEGNGGLSAAAPPVHVVLMGIEKIIPRLSDLPVFLQLLARAATGQKLTTYTHHFLGPENGRAMYCVLVDAGRTSLLADPRTRASLYCIRCGACLNVCPIYRRVGGWAYGSVYGGPIGSVLTPNMIGIEQAGELPFASTLCGACREECPVDIDLPNQLVYMRSRAVDRHAGNHAARDRRSPPQTTEGRLLRAWAKAMMTLGDYRRGINFARAALGIVRSSPWKPGILGAWSAQRELPRVADETFKEWWRRRR